MTRRDPEALAAWLLSTGVALAVAGVVVQTTVHLFHSFVAQSVDSLSADRDAFSAFAWASSTATFGAAFAALLLYGITDRARLLALALILAFLSLDDVVAGHERLAARAETTIGAPELSQRILWIVMFLPLIGAAFVLLAGLAKELGPRARRFVHIGLALLVFAIAAEASAYLTKSYGHPDGSTYDSFEVVAEEGAELAASILIAAALTSHVPSTLFAASGGVKRVN
jgi:hypothetical protein